MGLSSKKMTVHEVAKLTGITTNRTLHYYDEIGLLRPSIVTATNYRTILKTVSSKYNQKLMFAFLAWLHKSRTFKV